jgi:hypothetical protein
MLKRLWLVLSLGWAACVIGAQFLNPAGRGQWVDVPNPRGPWIDQWHDIPNPTDSPAAAYGDAKPFTTPPLSSFQPLTPSLWLRFPSNIWT